MCAECMYVYFIKVLIQYIHTYKMDCVGVILVNTPSIESSNRFFAMRKAVKGFADSMLDLTVQNSVAKLVRNGN